MKFLNKKSKILESIIKNLNKNIYVKKLSKNFFLNIRKNMLDTILFNINKYITCLIENVKWRYQKLYPQIFNYFLERSHCKKCLNFGIILTKIWYPIPEPEACNKNWCQK